MHLNEETVSRTDIFKGRIFTVHCDEARLENGKVKKREVVDHPGGVCVAALTPDKELLFVEQFRYPYGKVLLELPAGKLEPGEDPFEAIQRELKEETGCVGKNYRFLGELYPTPGYCGEIIRLWCCEVESEGDMNPDEDEFLEVKRIDYKEAVRMVMDNSIPDSKTQVLVLKTARLIEAGEL